ncbi:MAG: endonuclease NucS domain-containing protein [Thermoleophilia bacterium]
MGTEIRTWQIVEGKLQHISTNLKNEGRTEPYDLEPWIQSNPDILGPDIVIIGRQTTSRSGPIDLLGIDKTGNVVIVELKRDKLPREALAQAIDYASDAADWTVERLGEICAAYSGKTLEETLAESFPDLDVETLKINETQRIVLVGFSIESSLERMIQWLSDHFSVNINAVVLSYLKTASGDELLSKTSIISEELEQERVQKQKKFLIPMSDEPGEYEPEALTRLLRDYLARDQITNRRIRAVLLPALLSRHTVTREQLKQELIKYEPTLDASKAGYSLTPLSMQLGLKRNDFLRQVVAYEYPNYAWEKDNFSLREKYEELVREVLAEINERAGPTTERHIDPETATEMRPILSPSQ